MDSIFKRAIARIIPVSGLVGPVLLVILTGCVRLKTEPIRVEPIYIEITINHRVQEALDDLFADIDQASETTEYEPLAAIKADQEN